MLKQYVMNPTNQISRGKNKNWRETSFVVSQVVETIHEIHLLGRVLDTDIPFSQR